MMCVSYCHRRNALYWNHEDCQPWDCSFARGPHGRCADCRHRCGDFCWLTNAPLPESGGCCHHDVALAHGLQVVTREMVEPLGVLAGETPAEVLERTETRYQRGDNGQVLVSPDELALPMLAYGVGSESVEEEAFEWPDWPLDM
jgi:hypothetical protein